MGLCRPRVVVKTLDILLQDEKANTIDVVVVVVFVLMALCSSHQWFQLLRPFLEPTSHRIALPSSRAIQAHVMGLCEHFAWMMDSPDPPPRPVLCFRVLQATNWEMWNQNRIRIRTPLKLYYSWPQNRAWLKCTFLCNVMFWTICNIFLLLWYFSKTKTSIVSGGVVRKIHESCNYCVGWGKSIKWIFKLPSIHKGTYRGSDTLRNVSISYRETYNNIRKNPQTKSAVRILNGFSLKF